jgi:hypothetical protein
MLVTIFWKKKLKKIFIFSYYFFPVTDDSDEPTGLTRHLPRRLLAVHAEQRKRKRAAVGNRAVRLENDSDTEDEEEQRPVRPPRTQWTPQDPGLVGVNTPEFIKPVMSDENREKLEDLSTATITTSSFRATHSPMKLSSSQDCMQSIRD